MSYKQTRRDEAVADEYLGSFFPCKKCGAQTDRETLVTYGAQCYGCYCSYVAEANPANPHTGSRRELIDRLRSATGGIDRSDAKQVARRLRQLEASGMHLTASQRWVLERCEARSGVSA